MNSEEPGIDFTIVEIEQLVAIVGKIVDPETQSDPEIRELIYKCQMVVSIGKILEEG